MKDSREEIKELRLKLKEARYHLKVERVHLENYEAYIEELERRLEMKNLPIPAHRQGLSVSVKQVPPWHRGMEKKRKKKS